MCWCAVVLLVVLAAPPIWADTNPVPEVMVTILRLDFIDGIPGRDATNAVAVLNKKIPNGKATLLLKRTWGHVEICAYPVRQRPDGTSIRLGELTDRLQIQWSPTKDRLPANRLVEAKVQFFPCRD